MNAEILPIGNELLSGRVVDTNSPFISRSLAGIGIRTRWITAVGDDEEEILSALKRAWGRADIVIATGGLGPTDDDITRHAIAQAFGLELELRPELLKQLHEIFSRLNRPCAKTNEIQAFIPKGAESIINPVGTAPGIFYGQDGKSFFSLPGVPREMKAMLTDSVLPRLQTSGNNQIVLERALRTAGIGESALFAILENNIERGPVRIGYLPEIYGVAITLSAGPLPLEQAQQEIERVHKRILSLAKDYVFGCNEDTLAGIVGGLLRSKGSILSVAESCTGGLLGGLVTEIPGSSEYFSGGWITYSNQQKTANLGVDKALIERFGAVSCEVAEAMAEGARIRSGSDFAISITGIAGPGGATPDKPVGTVWIALASNKPTVSEKSVFLGNRAEIRMRSAMRALFLLWKQLKAE